MGLVPTDFFHGGKEVGPLWDQHNVSISGKLVSKLIVGSHWQVCYRQHLRAGRYHYSAAGSNSAE